MNVADIEAAVRRVLGNIAPNVDATAVDGSADLRDTLDLDSMDHLSFVIGLSDATGVDVPERDYPKLTTIDSVVAYLVEHA